MRRSQLKLGGGQCESDVSACDLLSSPEQIDTADGLMFIGGFSYGDHMTSGHVFAQRIKHHLQPRLQTFIGRAR